MDLLLEISSEPVWVVATFIFALVFFHYLWLIHYPLTLRQWKLVEYIWVALTLVSVIGIIGEARFYKTDITVEQSREKATVHMEAFQNWFDVYTEYACVDNAAEDLYTPLCGWVSQKTADLDLIVQNEDFPYDIPVNFLAGLNDGLGGIGQVDRDIIISIHMKYLEARMQYIGAMTEGQFDNIYAFLVSLAPMLFAIAVAIKFAKVTGEYRLTKK